MNSREKILSSIGAAPALKSTPDFSGGVVTWENRLVKFSDVLRSIGGAVVEVQSYSGIREYLLQHFDESHRIVSAIPLDRPHKSSSPAMHPYDNVEVALLKGSFAVAENGSVWITDDLLPDPVLPFICQQLMIVVNKYDIVNTMHDAYERIGNSDYGFGTFIAGPSKTADIEQSLVLGAHGPKSMTVFLVEETPD
jgi:L-lactate dehydrogenase complex protein LldG